MYSYNHCVGYPLLIFVLVSMSDCYKKSPNLRVLHNKCLFFSQVSLVQVGVEEALFYSHLEIQVLCSPVPCGGILCQTLCIQLWARESMTYLYFTSAHIPLDRIQSRGLTNHREASETLSTMCPGKKGKGFGEPSLSLCPPRELNWDGGRKNYKLRWVYRAPLEKKKIFCTSLPVFTQVSFLISVKRLEYSFLWLSLATHLLPVFSSPLWENEEKRRREIMFWSI